MSPAASERPHEHSLAFTGLDHHNSILEVARCGSVARGAVFEFFFRET
jgi:hypothetical protein